MTMAYTVNRFSIRGEDRACGAILNIPHQSDHQAQAYSVCIFCWQDRQETGRARSMAIMSVHGTLIYACCFHVE
jgi:hypothetical protein